MAYSCGYWTHPAPTPTARRGPGRQARPGLPQARPQPGMRCSTSAVAGARCRCTPPSTSAPRSSASRSLRSRSASSTPGSPSAGCEDRVEIRLQDYREVPERDHFDAVGSLEMGEHVGEGNYPTYAEVLRRSVKPGGRVLVQQMSRTGQVARRRPLHRVFIAPDMHMRPVGETVALPRAGGLEVRDVHGMREHYVPPCRLARPLRGQPPAHRAGRRGGRCGCGGSTSSAGCWPSATAGWASTRSCGAPRRTTTPSPPAALLVSDAPPRPRRAPRRGRRSPRRPQRWARGGSGRPRSSTSPGCWCSSPSPSTVGVLGAMMPALAAARARRPGLPAGLARVPPRAAATAKDPRYAEMLGEHALGGMGASVGCSPRRAVARWSRGR